MNTKEYLDYLRRRELLKFPSVIDWCKDETIRYFQSSKEQNVTVKDKNVALESKLRANCDYYAHECYGKILPAQVAERLEYELEMICRNGNSRLYLLAYEIAKACVIEGIPQLARGCAGSSYVAFLLHITRTSPLVEHLYCPCCGYTDFVRDYDKYRVDKKWTRVGACFINTANGVWYSMRCPFCNGELKEGGHNIPPEPFFGLEGEKTPIFELDVPAELKDGVEELLARILDDDELLGADSDEQYVESINSVKINGNPLLSMLNNLQDLTEVIEAAIPFEGIVYNEFFRSNMHSEIPLLDDIPQAITDKYHIESFADMINVLGLHHGAGVWENNAEIILSRYPPNGAEKLIAHREDIMLELMRHGVEREKAFHIMETVRRGKALQLTDEDIAVMKDAGVSDEYIDSMMKIRYLFPKSHDTEFGIRIFKLMWYSRYYYEEYSQALKEYKDALSSGKGE